MKRHPFILSLIGIGALSIVLSVALRADEIVQSVWTASPLQIDGQSEDWTGSAVTSEKGIKVDYAFRNDGRDLYILLVFKDPKSLSSIDLTGITLYANLSGKKDKDMGTRFLKKTVTGEQLIEYMEKMGRPLPEDRQAEIKDKPQLILFTATAVNKKGEEVFPAGPTSDFDLPGFRIGRQENAVLYEFRIPLVSRDVHPTGIGGAPGATLKIGFEWGGLTKEMREAMRSQNRGSGTGSDLTQETATGSYAGAPSSGPGGPKKYSFWTDVKLAQQAQ
jgi:hypothetical protein